MHLWVDVRQNKCAFVAGLVVSEEATRELMPSPPDPLSKDLFVYLCIYVLVFVYLYLCICVFVYLCICVFVYLVFGRSGAGGRGEVRPAR